MQECRENQLYNQFINHILDDKNAFKGTWQRGGFSGFFAEIGTA
jgi:hypothetical protein